MHIDQKLVILVIFKPASVLGVVEMCVLSGNLYQVETIVSHLSLARNSSGIRQTESLKKFLQCMASTHCTSFCLVSSCELQINHGPPCKPVVCCYIFLLLPQQVHNLHINCLLFNYYFFFRHTLFWSLWTVLFADLALVQRAIQKARSLFKRIARDLSSLWDWSLSFTSFSSSINAQQKME